MPPCPRKASCTVLGAGQFWVAHFLTLKVHTHTHTRPGTTPAGPGFNHGQPPNTVQCGRAFNLHNPGTDERSLEGHLRAAWGT